MRGHNILLWHPRLSTARILLLHKTLGERYKNSYPTTTRTQKFSCPLKIHRSQTLKLRILLISPITRAPKISFVLKAPQLTPPTFCSYSVSPSSHHTSPLFHTDKPRFHHASRRFTRNPCLATGTRFRRVFEGDRHPCAPRCPSSCAAHPPRHHHQQHDSGQLEPAARRTSRCRDSPVHDTEGILW